MNDPTPLILFPFPDWTELGSGWTIREGGKAANVLSLELSKINTPFLIHKSERTELRNQNFYALSYWIGFLSWSYLLRTSPTIGLSHSQLSSFGSIYIITWATSFIGFLLLPPEPRVTYLSASLLSNYWSVLFAPSALSPAELLHGLPEITSFTYRSVSLRFVFIQSVNSITQSPFVFAPSALTKRLGSLRFLA